MSENNKDKVVLITGASSGIGRAVAFEFARAGYSLAITYNKNKDGGQQTVNKCLKLGVQDIMLAHLDLNDDQSIKNCIENIIEKYKKINILINNAGYLKSNGLNNQTFESINYQIKINLEGLIKITKQCLPYIQEGIINIGSTLGLYGKKNLSIYSAAKFGVRGFTKSLAQELPEFKIYTVNPGLTNTKMGHERGVSPNQVAKIIFNAATGQYKAKSGSDINVKDYEYGEFWKNIILFFRFIKRIIKKLLTLIS